MEDLYLSLNKGLYKIDATPAPAEISPEQIASGSLLSSFNQVINVLQSGKTQFTNVDAGYILGLDKGTAKFYIGSSTNYLNWTGTSLVISGSISASAIDIGSGFHVDSSGNVWWGSDSTYAAATIKISSAGSVNFTTGTFSGVIQTASSGQRITINNTANTIIFYDSTAQVIGIGTDAGNAIKLTLTAGTNNGVIATSSSAGIGFSYTNSADVSNTGLTISQGSGSLTTNPSPAIDIAYGGVGYIVNAIVSGTGNGILISRTVGNGGGHLISLVSSTNSSGNLLDLTRTGVMTATQYAIGIDQSTGTNSAGKDNYGIVMSLSTGGASSKNYAFRFNGSEISSSAIGGSQDKKIKVSVSGTDYFIPLYTA